MLVVGHLRLQASIRRVTRATPCACSRRIGFHRRHVADRRAPGAPTCRPAIRRRCTTACSTGSSSSIQRSKYSRRTTTSRSGSSTIAQELASNPRLQQRERAAFVEMMQHLNLTAPTHLTEALRTNMTGGKTVGQLLEEASAQDLPFVSLAELNARIASTQWRARRARRPRARRIQRRSRPGRAPPTARPARAAGERGASRPDDADRDRLRVRQDLHARSRDVARAGVSARDRARWRYESVAGKRFSRRIDRGRRATCQESH